MTETETRAEFADSRYRGPDLIGQTIRRELAKQNRLLDMLNGLIRNGRGEGRAANYLRQQIAQAKQIELDARKCRGH